MPEQIVSMDLPTRPTKRTDSRAKGFEGESVEVDAIPPKTLRQIASNCITQHVNHDLIEGLVLAEHGEREALMAMAQGIHTESFGSGQRKLCAWCHGASPARAKKPGGLRGNTSVLRPSGEFLT